jgi:hypothetical protein
MGNNTIQIPADDGCVYVYNVDNNKLKKVCDIVEEKEIPQSVRDILVKLNRRVALNKE